MENDTYRIEAFAGPADGQVVNLPREFLLDGYLIYVPVGYGKGGEIEIHAYEVCWINDPRPYWRLEHLDEVDKVAYDDCD